MKQKLLAVLLAGLMLVVVGCGGSPPETSDGGGESSSDQSDGGWAAIEEAGLQEGAITLLHNTRPAGIQDLIAAFNEAYPDIIVEQVRLGSGKLLTRFESEYGAGQSNYDVVITFYDAHLDKWRKDGWMTEWTPPEIAAYAEEMNIENKMFAIQTSREAIIYNKNHVSEEEAPKEWKELFDPKWKGKCAMNMPWRSVPIQQIILYWEKEVGIEDPAAAFEANECKFFKGSSGVLQGVVTGEAWVAETTDLQLNPALKDGAPIGVIYPESGTTATKAFIFVPDKAPNMNAGKVFANWILSEEGQLALQTHAGLPVNHPDVPAPEHIPATRDLNTIDGSTLLTPEDQTRIVEHWQETFGIK